MSKVLVISDTHLSHKYDERKCDFLCDLFSRYEKIIINGDFWSVYSTTFDKFVTSPWSRLFPILKEKNTVYIYGNHDQKMFSDDRVELFSEKQAYYLDLDVGDRSYHIEHGHKFFKYESAKNPFLLTLNRFLRIEKYIREPFEKFMVEKVGLDRLFLYLNRLNTQIKRKSTPFFDAGKVLVTGHTHFPELDQGNGFVNTGFVNLGKAWYLEIDDSGYFLKSSTY